MTMTVITEGGDSGKNELGKSPKTLDILRILAGAGKAGMLAPDIAYQFSKPVLQQRRNAVVNQVLKRLSRSDRVRYTTDTSPRYHNIPAYRWFITSAGSKYLADGGYDEIIKRISCDNAEKLEQQRQNRQQQDVIRQLVINAAPVLIRQLPPGCTKARANLINQLYQRGITLDDIGRLLGLTRERVRQIKAGIKVTPCRCQQCGNSLE